MKVHLISTPEVHPQLMDQIHEILSGVAGPMEFSKLNMDWNPDDLTLVNQHRMRNDYRFKIDSEYEKEKYIAQRGYPLSWREFFFMCNRARTYRDLEDDDFVILVTYRRNSMNFFSMFDTDGKRNAFVQASDWEIFLEAPEALPVAYEVVANVLRILMKFDLNRQEDIDYHSNPIGCMNDFCQNKREIVLKLRTADICGSCLTRLEGNGTGESVIIHALNIFENIRGRLLFSQGFVRNIKPKPLRIDADGTIFVGDDILPLQPMAKTIFIFFLNHPEGVRISELEDYKNELFSIYSKTRANPDPLSIDNLVNNIDSNFTYNKSRLTKSLREGLGEPLANYYFITGRPGERFSIPLPRNLIDIDHRFITKQN